MADIANDPKPSIAKKIKDGAQKLCAENPKTCAGVNAILVGPAINPAVIEAVAGVSGKRNSDALMPPWRETKFRMHVLSRSEGAEFKARHQSYVSSLSKESAIPVSLELKEGKATISKDTLLELSKQFVARKKQSGEELLKSDIELTKSLIANVKTTGDYELLRQSLAGYTAGREKLELGKELKEVFAGKPKWMFF